MPAASNKATKQNTMKGLCRRLVTTSSHMVQRLGFLVFTQAARVRLPVWERNAFLFRFNNSGFSVVYSYVRFLGKQVVVFTAIFNNTDGNNDNDKLLKYFSNFVTIFLDNRQFASLHFIFDIISAFHEFACNYGDQETWSTILSLRSQQRQF